MPAVFLGAQLAHQVAREVMAHQLGREAARPGLGAHNLLDMRPGRMAQESWKARTAASSSPSRRPAQTAKTMGSPVISSHSAPRSLDLVGEARAGSIRRAGSPMTSAASAAFSMAGRSGATRITRGTAP